MLLTGKRHLLVFQWGGEQPIEWSLVLSPYSVGPVIAISLSLPCPALSSFTRSTLPPCIDIGSAWESAIEWGSLIAVGEVPGCSPPFLGTSLFTGCSFPRSVFLSSVYNFSRKFQRYSSSGPYQGAKRKLLLCFSDLIVEVPCRDRHLIYAITI